MRSSQPISEANHALELEQKGGQISLNIPKKDSGRNDWSRLFMDFNLIKFLSYTDVLLSLCHS